MGTLTVVGELDPSQTKVPVEFQGVYNVRYTRKIYVSSGVNTQPILFYNQPSTEIVKTRSQQLSHLGSITKPVQTGEPIPEELGKTLNVENDEEPPNLLKNLKNNLRFKSRWWW